jgi:hypothetical protein
MARGYGGLMMAVVEDRPGDIPGVLREMGVTLSAEAPIPLDVTDPWFQVVAPIVRSTPPYSFGADETMYDQLLEASLSKWPHAAEMRFPEDIVFIDRALAGHFGNLIRLHATGPWRDLVRHYAGRALEP